MANKRRTRTRTQQSTFGTDLGSVIRSNLDNFNPLSFSFVLDKTLQLEETPITNPIIHSFSSPSISNTFEVFHNNLASIKIVYNFLADAMINCSYKTLLSARDSFKQSSSRPCAFALQFISQELEFPFNLFDFGRVEELPVRSDCKIMDSQVHTENSVRTRTDGAFLGECEQEEALAFRINPQKAFINFPTEIIFEALRDNEWNFDSAFDCGDAQDIIFKRKTSGRIVSDRTEFNKRFTLSFLDKSTGLFYAGNGELGRQAESSQVCVNKWMEFDIILDSHLPCFVNTQLQSCLVDGNSVNNLLPWFNSNFSCCSDSHDLLRGSDYLNTSEGIFPPKLESMGIQNAQFI